jgi:hypothetical protein
VSTSHRFDLNHGLISKLRSDSPDTEVALLATLRTLGVGQSAIEVPREQYLDVLGSLYREFETPLMPVWRDVATETRLGAEALLGKVTSLPNPMIQLSPLQLARDIGVASGIFLSRGAALACPVRGGFSRGACLRHGWRTFLSRFSLARRMLVVSPRIELHTNDRFIDDFNREVWCSLFYSVGCALRSAVGIDAVVTTAWYTDPTVASISPHLGFLHDIPQQGGAVFFAFPSTLQDTAFALKKSRKRRNAHAQGQYTPRPTFMYWSSDDLIKWAAKVRQTPHVAR